MATNSVSTNFVKVFTPPSIQFQYSTGALGTAGIAKDLPNTYGGQNTITNVCIAGPGASMADYFKVEVCGNIGTGNSTGVVGTLYSSLSGTLSGNFPGASLCVPLQQDCWIRVTPNVGNTNAPLNTFVGQTVGAYVTYNNLNQYNSAYNAGSTTPLVRQ